MADVDSTAAQTTGASRPNFIVILADDLGYGELGAYGSEEVLTPRIDSLVTRGMKFDYFYANCPVCSPTRASLLTGMYPELVGVPGVIRTDPNNSWGDLATDVDLLPTVMKNSGYHTAIVGKWHLGLDSKSHPNRRGFDEFRGFLGDMMDDYYDHRRHGINYMRHQQAVIDPEGHATDLFSEWACDYLETRVDEQEPFFLYLAYNAPHTPIQPPEDWLAKVKQRNPEMSERRAKLVALIEHMDHGIGQVLDKLDSTGFSSNTVVIFTSDNGGQLNVGADNGELRDGKQSMFEGGLRVPCVAVWPDRIAPQSVSAVRAATMDLFPTICELSGVSVPEGLDGVSIASILLGNADQIRARDLFFHRREGGERYGGMNTHALLRGDWKLVRNTPFEPYRLFNLADDPQEENDLVASEQQIRRELSAAMRRHLQRGGAIPWQPSSRR